MVIRPSRKSPAAVIDVTVVLLERALPSTSVAPIEIFSCAGVLWQTIHRQPLQPRFAVRAVSLDGEATSHSIPVQLKPEGTLASVKRTDLIIVPTAEFDSDASYRANAVLIPGCAAGTRAGRASPASAPACRCWPRPACSTGGRRPPTGRSSTNSGGATRTSTGSPSGSSPSRTVFCGGGVYAAIDLSLYLVEKYCGHEVAVQTAKALLLETPRIWQSTYAAAPPRSAHDDEAMQRAQNGCSGTSARRWSLDELAARVGMSPRNFARRFKAATGEAPLGYLHRLRIDAARHFLETRGKSVAEIGQAVGYEDVGFFRRLFKRHTGAPPQAYRARFGPGARRAAAGTQASPPCPAGLISGERRSTLGAAALGRAEPSGLPQTQRHARLLSIGRLAGRLSRGAAGGRFFLQLEPGVRRDARRFVVRATRRGRLFRSRRPLGS